MSPPITMSSVYALPEGSDPIHQYGRWSNPTWSALEEALTMLEKAPAPAFPSGMAATAAVMYGLLGSGDKILLPSDAYYGTRMFTERYLPSLAVKNAQLADRVRDWRRYAGAVPGPFEAWLIHRIPGDIGGAILTNVL